MRKLTLAVLAATALVGLTAPASAQFYFGVGSGGVSVGVGTPYYASDYYYGPGYAYYGPGYGYYGGPAAYAYSGGWSEPGYYDNGWDRRYSWGVTYGDRPYYSYNYTYTDRPYYTTGRTYARPAYTRSYASCRVVKVRHHLRSGRVVIRTRQMC